MSKIGIYNIYYMKIYFLPLLLLFSSCTYSITLVHTSGQANDIVDETATNSPSTDVTPTIAIPASVI